MNEMKIEDVRFMFKGRVGLFPFAGNYENDKKVFKNRLAVQMWRKGDRSSYNVRQLPNL